MNEENIVNWYGFQINGDDSTHILAHNEMQAMVWVANNWAEKGDDIEVTLIGTADANHWENEHTIKAWEI